MSSPRSTPSLAPDPPPVDRRMPDEGDSGGVDRPTLPLPAKASVAPRPVA